MRVYKILFGLIFLLFLPQAVGAVGVSVEPAYLEIIYSSDKTTDLTVTNVSQEPVIVSIFPDELIEQIQVYPSELNLLPEEVAQIELSFDFDEKVAGIKKASISVVTKALNKRSFNAASGLKIPVTIAIIPNKFQWQASTIFLAVFFGLLLLAILTQLIFILFRPKKSGLAKAIDFVLYHRQARLRRWLKKIFH